MHFSAVIVSRAFVEPIVWACNQMSTSAIRKPTLWINIPQFKAGLDLECVSKARDMFTPNFCHRVIFGVRITVGS